MEWGMMIDRNLFKKVARRIDAYRTAMIDLQVALCSVPAIGPENHGDGEFLKARLLEKHLLQLGFKNILHFDAPDDRVSSRIRPNLIVTLAGKINQNSYGLLLIWILYLRGN